MRLTEKQFTIIRIIQDKGSATVRDFDELGLTQKATAAHLRRLLQLGNVYISHWKLSGKYGMKPVYKLGNKPSMTKMEAAYILTEERRAIREAAAEKARRAAMKQHFIPRPDYAAAWLFNQPAVALQGARYE